MSAIARRSSDFPDPDGPGPGYSMPAGDFLFARDFLPGAFTVKAMPPSLQGWFDPFTGFWAANDHVIWRQINIEDIEVGTATIQIASVVLLELKAIDHPGFGCFLLVFAIVFL